MTAPARVSGANKKGDRTAKDAELSDLLLRACHDLRAPVRAVRTHAELFVRDQAPTGDAAQRLAYMLDGAQKIDSLVEALASYSIALRIDPETFQPTPMNAMLRGVLARMNAELQTSQAEVTHGDLPRVLGNPDRLIELLERLIQNAIRHHGGLAPIINVTAKKRGRMWWFKVSDNGPGIEADYLERIFRPFERVRGGASAGHGMGLAICRAIVERHGGKLGAESEPGKGAAFLFSLSESH